MKLKEFIETFMSNNPVGVIPFTLYKDTISGSPISLYEYTRYDELGKYVSFTIDMVPEEYRDAEVKFINSYLYTDSAMLMIVIDYENELTEHRDCIREFGCRFANLKTETDRDNLYSKYMKHNNINLDVR